MAASAAGQNDRPRGKPSGMELLARIGPDHRLRLAWFEDYQGKVTGMPAPLEGGLLLASKRKGI